MRHVAQHQNKVSFNEGRLTSNLSALTGLAVAGIMVGGRACDMTVWASGLVCRPVDMEVAMYGLYMDAVGAG